MSSNTSSYELDVDEEEDTLGSQKSHITLESKIFIRSMPFKSSGLSPSELSEDHGLSRLQSRTSQKAQSRLRAIRRKRWTKTSVTAYHEMLDEMIRDPLSGFPIHDGITESQHGIVIWTSKEKEVLFDQLARKGKSDIPKIAKAIGSKSQLEVQQYIRTLQNALGNEYLQVRHQRPIHYSDIPAATEVSEECRKALDEFAEYLLLNQQNSENVAGQKQHGDLWIITREKAEQLNDQITANDPSLTRDSSSIFLTASILNIKKWLELSDRFFMNFGGPRLQDNWVNLAYKDESPSITCDAFADFYAIAVSITRRLIQSSIFFALSRIRNMRVNTHRKAKLIKAQDVSAALKVLNMKEECFTFWVGVARRCSLDIADIRHKKGWKTNYMDYNEVEDVLSVRGPLSVTPCGKGVFHAPHGDSHLDSDDGCETEGSDMLSDEPPTHCSIASSQTSTSDEVHPGSEDGYVDYIDRQRSWNEEFRIRQLFQLPILSSPEAPASMEYDQQEKSPKSVLDLGDWRDKTIYRSEWEEYGRNVHQLHEELIENRRKRRQLAGEESSTASSCHGPVMYPGRHGGGDEDEAEVILEEHQDTATDNSDVQQLQLDDGGSDLNDFVDVDVDTSDGVMEIDEGPDISILAAQHPRRMRAVSGSWNSSDEGSTGS